jgi:hypothetical protein
MCKKEFLDEHCCLIRGETATLVKRLKFQDKPVYVFVDVSGRSFPDVMPCRSESDNKTECFKRDMNEGCGGINGPSLSSSRTGGVGGGAGGGGGRLELRPLFLAMVALAGRASLFGRCAFREKLGLHCITILGVGQNFH